MHYIKFLLSIAPSTGYKWIPSSWYFWLRDNFGWGYRKWDLSSTCKTCAACIMTWTIKSTGFTLLLLANPFRGLSFQKLKTGLCHAAFPFEKAYSDASMDSSDLFSISQFKIEISWKVYPPSSWLLVHFIQWDNAVSFYALTSRYSSRNVLNSKYWIAWLQRGTAYDGLRFNSIMDGHSIRIILDEHMPLLGKWICCILPFFGVLYI
jgi:hypothetical protein